MARVVSNRRLAPDFYLLEAELPGPGDSVNNVPGIRSGQFCMLRSWEADPLLSRPLSVFDAAEGRIAFLYKTVGRGTAIFSRLREGDNIAVQGPLGSGFPGVPPSAAQDSATQGNTAQGRIAMVGGGAGIAPFYLGAKQYRSAGCVVDLYLGFSGESFLESEYHAVADNLVVQTGGFITDRLDPGRYDQVFCCGPEGMMRTLWEKCRAAGAEDRAFVSLESRMACGVGACYGCSRKTASGNKKVCRDGPVFAAGEVFGL
ncbi:MAG: dihydroorotate dehydrogenase electron transfer subunit [Treponema sp.]|jgi:dihydroorotate dehydrogenase electron transfer subunit|nr:dihydroorotate dehydrogenase electron transfer subunit [Treponema sp.]